MTLMTFSLLCNKQSGGQTPGPLRFNHICKDARSRPLTNGMSDLSTSKKFLSRMRSLTGNSVME